jgi:choline dehydrogenase
MFWPRGRVLGGSSSVNGMLWVRGEPAEYDNWRNLGNPGWSYEDILPL